MKKFTKIALVGATGLVGQEFMRQLDATPGLEEVRLIASDDSKGELFSISGLECQVDTLTEESFFGLDIVFLAAPKEVCLRAIEIANHTGIQVVDATQPEKQVSENHFVVSDPVTSLVLPILKALSTQLGGNVIISTYQAVSGAGRAGVDELWNQTLGIFNQSEAEQESFEQPIAFNCIPQIDLLNEQGISRMEIRVAQQLAEQLAPAEPTIFITGVRVPSLFGISATITATVEGFEKATFESALAASEVEYHSDPAEIITPLQVVGDGKIHVSRLRQKNNLVSLWVTADNIQTCLVTEAMKYLR